MDWSNNFNTTETVIAFSTSRKSPYIRVTHSKGESGVVLTHQEENMKSSLISNRPMHSMKEGHTKAILRGGTFHRVQVLVPQGQNYVEHCGLNYKVTHQKDEDGRLICVWARN
jgi:hypothetical protein